MSDFSSIIKPALKKNITANQRKAFENLIKKEQEYDAKILELEEAKKALAAQSEKLVETQIALEAERIDASNQLKAFQKQYEHYAKMEEDLTNLKNKVTTSYSTKDLSTYLNQIISTFNASTESDSEIATYVINNMEVDLKVRIYGEDNEIHFTAPSISETTEDSLSSIKISIQAVPK